MDALAEIRVACPELVLRSAGAESAALGVDALTPSRGRPELAQLQRSPLAVAEPSSVADVVALVRWAGEARVPLVARGGGSGLMGAATVLQPVVVVDLHRLDRVAVEPDACVVHAGAGATLARVDAALAEHGLMLGHDPWTIEVATVGGALGTNGLGYLGGRAGSMGAQLRALEVVLADGTVVHTAAVPARSTGLDLARLFVGTEGTLGIVTEATLVALPRPEERIVASYELPSFDVGVSLAAAFRRSGIRPSCLELAADGLPPRAASLLLVFDGLRGEASLHAARADELLRRAGASPRERALAEREWDARHAIAERWAASRRSRPSGTWRLGGEFDYAHVAVPLRCVPAVRDATHALVRRHGLSLVEEGLWHWPELYSVVVSGSVGSASGVRATIDGVCTAAQDAGGSMEYCHGVGWKLAHLMTREHGTGALAVLRRVKTVLDPAGILNPGKGGV
jgi:FAD/FMN-containing dehydrogenase